LVSNSPEQTQALGRMLGQRAEPGDVYLLLGNLGAGKTCLTQGIAWGLDVKEYAMSPSFVIMREYHGRLPVYHMDFYRLENVPEIIALGMDEYFYGRGVSVVEWPDKALDELPVDRLVVSIDHGPLNTRYIRIDASGSRYHLLLSSLENQLKSGIGVEWNLQ
jgi:tRNA threonylcarbamoyladenosine biosynthesis protein TsaE